MIWVQCLLKLSHAGDTDRRELLRGNQAMNLLNANFLFASLFWGSVGFGYWIYGKRQSLWTPMIGGGLMIVASYFIGSALLMSLACIAIAVAVYFLARRGY